MGRPRIIAVDFDGTLCENKYPEIGEPNWKVIQHIKKQKFRGSKIILWTCRASERLLEALEWCHNYNIRFDAVNENLPEMIELFGSDTRKVYADEYIDDKMATKFKFPFRV